jgi:hypothetical protein
MDDLDADDLDVDADADDQMVACVFLDYVSNHRDSIGILVEDNPGRVREWAAEQGLELTPDECTGLLAILRTGLDIVGDGWSGGWSGG